MRRKFYLSTGFGNTATFREVADAFEHAGWELTFDWTMSGVTPESPTVELSDVAEFEVAGVAVADLLVVVLPGGLGTHCELGVALGVGIPVLLFAPPEIAHAPGRQTIFHAHRGVTIVETLEGLTGLLRAAEMLVPCRGSFPHKPAEVTHGRD